MTFDPRKTESVQKSWEEREKLSVHAYASVGQRKPGPWRRGGTERLWEGDMHKQWIFMWAELSMSSRAPGGRSGRGRRGNTLICLPRKEKRNMLKERRGG